MKNKSWNPLSSGGVATLPDPTVEAGDAQFDEVKYQPSLRTVEPPRLQAQTAGQNSAIREIQAAVQEHSTWVKPLRQELARVIVGQERLLDRLLIALVTNGHVLLEGVPGLAKTLSLNPRRRRQCALQAPPVHPGYAAGRHRRHDDL
jgi:hypothetical protein